jgi:hypothetical protein
MLRNCQLICRASRWDIVFYATRGLRPIALDQPHPEIYPFGEQLFHRPGAARSGKQNPEFLEVKVFSVLHLRPLSRKNMRGFRR